MAFWFIFYLILSLIRLQFMAIMIDVLPQSRSTTIAMAERPMDIIVP